MRRTLWIGMLLALTLPQVAWAAEAYMPVGTVVLSAFGMCAVGAAGVVCLKIYSSVKGGDLGMAWQTLAFALMFFGVALLVAAFFYGLSNLGMMPAGGTATSLPLYLSIVTVVAHFCFGALLSFGVGNYAPTLAMLSLMGFDPRLTQRIVRLVDANEYKRRQSAPGVKITPRAFGRDRRMPITNRFR